MLANGTVDEIIGRHRSLVVRASRWQEVFACLRTAGLPVSFEGRALRVADGREAEVRTLLDSAGERYEIEHVPASLEDMLAILPRRNASHA
jgi:Zn/Cd-binding protein ZinT